MTTRAVFAIGACFAWGLSAAGCSSDEGEGPSLSASDEGGLSDVAGEVGAGGADAGSDPGPAGDAGSDEGPPDEGAPDEGTPHSGLTVSAGAAATWCEASCAQILGSCGVIGGWTDAAICAEGCEAALAEDALFAANWQCIANVCDVEACGSGDPLSEIAGCDDACALIDSCGAAEPFGLPAGEVDLCTASCSGNAASQTGYGQLLTCVSDELTNNCDVLGATECVQPGGTDYCTIFCSDAFDEGAQGDDLYCADNATFTATWSTVQACIQDCSYMAAGDVDRQVMFGVCFFLGGCEAAPGCTDVPEAVDPQCAEACTGITALCGPSTEGILNPVICGPFCTLYGEQAGGVPDDAGECIAAIRECPPGGEDAKAGAFLGCTTTPPQSCVDACGTLNACAAPVGIPGCLEGCTQLSIGDPAGFQVLEGCIDAAGEDCEAALACIDQ